MNSEFLLKISKDFRTIISLGQGLGFMRGISALIGDYYFTDNLKTYAALKETTRSKIKAVVLFDRVVLSTESGKNKNKWIFTELEISNNQFSNGFCVDFHG